MRKGKLKKALALALTGAVIIGAFAGCGAKKDSSSDTKKEETKKPTDSKETSTGTAGKKPTGTSVSGKQVKTAKTGDSISYLWILMIAGSIAVIGGMIYVIRRRKQK